jgi:GNAT superfamily N-acetyltransferase
MDDLELLLTLRLEVLRDVFELPTGTDLSALEAANLAYYQANLDTDKHVACLAFDPTLGPAAEPLGCGALCLFDEMPSPDNPTGTSGLLMNIYTRPAHRHRGVATAVLQWLLEQANIRDVSRLYLEATPQAAPLYAQAGFTTVPAMMQLQR